MARLGGVSAIRWAKTLGFFAGAEEEEGEKASPEDGDTLVEGVTADGVGAIVGFEVDFGNEDIKNPRLNPANPSPPPPPPPPVPPGLIGDLAFDFAGVGAAKTGTGRGVNSSLTLTTTGAGKRIPPIEVVDVEVVMSASGESGGRGTDSSKETDFLRGAEGLRIDLGVRALELDGRRGMGVGRGVVVVEVEALSLIHI